MMKLANHLKRMLSALLIAVLVLGMLPVSAFAAGEPIVLLGGGSAEGYCFVGDSIFEGSHGRTDLEGGDAAVMDATLHRLAGIIPGDTVLLCGHGNATTMAREIATTPFYR